MTTPTVLAVVLALAALLAAWRLRRAPGRGAPKALLLALQPVCALLLYLALVPPPGHGTPGTLVVAMAGSDAASVAAAAGAQRVALPEAGELDGVARVPDLASALRRHPGTRAVQLVGSGLPARDRDAAAGWPLRYRAPAEHAGLADLASPPLLAPGAAFEVGGRVAGIAAARVELLDPAGRRVDLQAIGADGRFVLAGSSRAAGDVAFAVRVLDDGGHVRDRASVPVVSMATPPLRVLLLGGAPQPEWKYLRRWADDAGLDAQARLAVGGGIALGDDAPRLDAATLRKADLLIVDERALAGLSRTQQAALEGAIGDGLGVLVRIGGPLDGAQRAALAGLGLALRGGDDSVPLPLGPGDAGAEPAAARRAGDDVATAIAMPTLERRSLQPLDATLPVLMQDRAGTAYGWWRARGRGRVGVTTVVDSYRLVLAGQAGAHAALWSGALSTLARPRPRGVEIATAAWRGERTALCTSGDAIQLQAPDGTPVPVLRDAGGCAALWPRQAGWYRWRTRGGRAGVLYVRAPADAPALHANADRAATLALVASAPAAADAGSAAAPLPGARWPWWLAFVCAASLGWWLERRLHRAADPS